MIAQAMASIPSDIRHRGGATRAISLGFKGSGAPSAGRPRLLLLAVVAAAFLLVPAAQAFAAHTVTLKIEGSGSGEVVPIGATYQGTPPINCTYTAPGPEAGDCVVEMSDEGEEYEQVLMKAIAAPGCRIRRMETGSRQLRSLRHPQRHLSRRRILRPLRRRRR